MSLYRPYKQDIRTLHRLLALLLSCVIVSPAIYAPFLIYFCIAFLSLSLILPTLLRRLFPSLASQATPYILFHVYLSPFQLCCSGLHYSINSTSHRHEQRLTHCAKFSIPHTASADSDSALPTVSASGRHRQRLHTALQFQFRIRQTQTDSTLRFGKS